MSQQKIAAYMERHKIGPLFEDLMNKILRDQPEEPLIYMLRTVYKKAGVEIPQVYYLLILDLVSFNAYFYFRQIKEHFLS